MILTGKAPDAVAEFVAYAVIVCWFLFALVFLWRRRVARQREIRRDWTAMLGMMIQSVGYFIVWAPTMRRPLSSPLLMLPKPAEFGLAVLTVAIALGSVWLVHAAVRALGKQWAVAARLVEGHRLITEGPYRLVRNPIYTGMFGMLVATGLAMSRWPALLAAIVVFATGTYLRVRVEERLLRGQFGAEFDEYVRHVPAVIPGIW